MKKHIILDVDDTITSSYELNQQLFLDTFLPIKPDIDQDYVRKLHYAMKGSSMISQFSEVVKKYKIDIDPEILVRNNEILHKARISEMTIFDGVKELLQFFKQTGHIISFCSNRDKLTLGLIMKKYGFDHLIDNIVSCKEEGHEKPDPYCLINLLQKYLNISSSETIYFGDSKTDAEFAKNGGIDFIIVDHYLNNKAFYSMILQSFAGIEDELLVEVDEENREIGSIYKMQAHADVNKYHRATRIIVFNSEGKVILQKRSSSKFADPSLWDNHGGHQSFGQTILQCAKSELLEEIGIKGKLIFNKVELVKKSNQSEYVYEYYIIHDGPYNIQTQEVEEIKTFDPEKLLRHEYDDEYKFLNSVYESLGRLKSIWKKLKVEK